jgi:hypothetical protein
MPRPHLHTPGRHSTVLIKSLAQKEKDVVMKKVLTRCTVAFILLIAITFYLLGSPFGGLNADPPKRLSGPAVDIRTRLQAYQTPDFEPSQSDGRSIEEAPSSSREEGPPIVAQDQETFYSIADATVLQGYPNDNFGDATDMWAGYDDNPETMAQIARSLVQFDISSLPADVDITKATLWVYLVNSRDYPDTSRTITTYRITGGWVEDSVTWNNKPGYGSAYGSHSIVHGAWDWYDFDVTDLVKAWDNGTYTNQGVMLRGPEISGADSSRRGFSTREDPYGDTPYLVVEYQVIPPTPTHTPTATPTRTPTPTPTLPSSKIYLPAGLKNYVYYAPACDPSNNYCEDYDSYDAAYGPLEPNVAYRAYPDDKKDYYYFVVRSTASVTVRLTNYSALGWLIVRKDDPPALTAIDWDERKSGEDQTLEVVIPNLSPGKYYVHIDTTSGENTSNLYTLKVIQ